MVINLAIRELNLEFKISWEMVRLLPLEILYYSVQKERESAIDGDY